MKHLISILFIAFSLATQAQQSLHYQAVLRDPDGILLSDADIQFEFAIIAGGTQVYAETQSAHTDDYGQLSLNIGTGIVESGQWNTIPWGEAFIELLIRCDFTGDDMYDLITTEVLQSVPYAFSSKRSDLATESLDNEWSGGVTLHPKNPSMPLVVGDSVGQATLTVKGSAVIKPVDDMPVLLNEDTTLLYVADKGYIQLQAADLTSSFVLLLDAGIDIGQLLIIEALADGSSEIILNDATAHNMQLAGDMHMRTNDTITLIWNGSTWLELHRSVNAD